MNRIFKDDQDLARALGGLPRGKALGRDLWPDIAARLEQRSHDAVPRGSTWRGPALAASVAVAFLAGILLGQRLDTDLGQAGGSVFDEPGPALMRSIEASEREYQAAFQALAPIGIASTVFEVQDIERIRGSWAELQQAESSLLEALHQHPGNPYLGEKLLALRAQQLEFMKQLAMLDQNSRRKI